MADLVVPCRVPDVVNLREGRRCWHCDKWVLKRSQMWKYPDGKYLCIYCKTRLDEEATSK
jgi:hypothetical protein